MKLRATKTAGDPTLTIQFEPESDADHQFLKVATMVVVEGGDIEFANKEGEQALMVWTGIPGATLRR